MADTSWKEAIPQVYAGVIVDADAPGLSQPFTYSVPPELASSVCLGACVAVPFSGRELVGYIVDLSEDAPDLDSIKPISAVVSEACALAPPLIGLAKWMSDYYLAPLAHSTRAIVPEVMSATVSTLVRLVDPALVSPNSPNQRKIVEMLASLGGEADSDSLKVRLRVDGFAAALRQLRNRGAVEIARTLELPKARSLTVRALEMTDLEGMPEPDDLAVRAPKQGAILQELSDSGDAIRQSELLRKVGSSSSPAKALVDKGMARKVNIKVRRRAYKLPDTMDTSVLDPTPGQAEALRIIREGEGPHTTLIYGVTSSGKTEVYLRAIQDVLENGGTCISLVPEISLTTHLMDAYIRRFGDQIAILHSRLSSGERHDEWRRIESGEAKVVLGPRSAVFAPVRNLGLVVVDEEHEPSYKQEHSPRYNARQAAEERARAEGASVILGSATPSVETYHRALSGEIRLVNMDTRVDDRPMPTVRVVDQRVEFEQGRMSIFSQPLHESIADRLSRKEQVILFVNRRGFASFILCRSCGYTAQCPNCAVSLTLHAGTRTLQCHHCDETMPAPDVCPTCGGVHIKQFGIGTERVEGEVYKEFPDARVIRMDSDTMGRKGAHEKCLSAFRDGRADILVGTQMVAKGLDFPNVTLVGVISADTSLHLPDFRAAERTFQLLTQVSGRAGRGAAPGEVVVQTFSPEHYAIEAAAKQDYRLFYDQEIAFREELQYPPFSRFINVLSSDPMADYAESRLKEFADKLRFRVSDDVTILGPAAAPLSRLKGLYRYHLLVKSPLGSAEELRSAVHQLYMEIPPAVRNGMILDVDPQSML